MTTTDYICDDDLPTISTVSTGDKKRKVVDLTASDSDSDSDSIDEGRLEKARANEKWWRWARFAHLQPRRGWADQKRYNALVEEGRAGPAKEGDIFYTTNGTVLFYKFSGRASFSPKFILTMLAAREADGGGYVPDLETQPRVFYTEEVSPDNWGEFRRHHGEPVHPTPLRLFAPLCVP